LVAQLVEQRTENPRVGSSILSQATIRINKLRASFEMPVSFFVRNLCETLFCAGFAENQAFKMFGCCFLHIRQNVAVSVECQNDC
jgi:hypothetical protein